jgi:hypothetical protein
MKKILFRRISFVVILPLLIVTLSILSNTFAADFSATPTPNTTESGASNVQLNFTINNTDSEYNTTEINITIPLGFTFIEDSNITSASGSIFSNTSNVLTWSNTTASGFLENGTEQYFLFNISVPTGTGGHDFTVDTLDTNNSGNSTNVTITVSDTTLPSSIVTAPPTLTNASTTNYSYVEVNVTFTELNPEACLLDWNNQSNYTMTINTSQNFCYYNNTGLADGVHDYLVYVNDTSGNQHVNGTWRVSVETTSPAVTINYPADNQNISTNSMDINFTATDSVASTMNCSIYVDGSTSYSYNNDSVLNNTPDTDYTHPGLTVGSHNLTINCSDTNYTGTASSDFGVYADLTVNSITWNSTGTSPGDNLTTKNSNITVAVVVINTGSFNIAENVNLTLSWRGSPDNVENATVTISNESLTTGASNTTLYYQKIDTGTVTFGYWPITATLSTDQSEASTSNNALTVYKTVGYNVTLTESYSDTAWINDSIPAQTDPGGQVLYNVTITYANGSVVSGLVLGNFTVSETSPNSSRTYSPSAFNPNGNNYWFNITAPSIVGGAVQTGIHTLILNATSGNYTGTYTSGFNLTAPVPGSNPIGLYDLDLEGAADKYQVVNISVSNSGSKNINNVATSLAASAGVTLSYVFGGNCSNIVLLTPGESNSTACINLKVLASTTGSKTLYVNVSGKDDDNRFYYNYASYGFTVQDTGNASNGGNGGNGGTGGTGGTVTSPYSLSITDYTSTFTATAGDSIETTIKVKNTANLTFTAKVSVVLPSLASVSVSPGEKSLTADEEATFTINMTLPADIEIGNYIGTFKAEKSDDTNVVTEKAFTITVEPTAEQTVGVNDTFANYTTIYDNLKTRFDAIKSSGLINETNLTAAEDLISEILGLMNQTQALIDSGDYSGAAAILAQIETKLDSAQGEIETLELQVGGGFLGFLTNPLFLAAIGIVVVVILVFVYYNFFMHKGGFAPRTGYKYGQKSPGIMGNLSERMKLIKGSMGSSKPATKSSNFTKPSKPVTPTTYKEGYVKQDDSKLKFKPTKRPGEGFKERVKGFFSKKDKSQKSMGDFSK